VSTSNAAGLDHAVARRGGAGPAAGRHTLDVKVNGRARTVAVEPHHTLLDVLRADLGLTGTKECCLVGECGACTVLVDGRSVDSCLVLALEVGGTEVVTVEGLATDGRLDPLQQAFLDHGAAQCGFCIPGQLVAARALLAAIARPSRAEVEDGLAGNLCRCGGYEQIIEAVLDASERATGPAVPPSHASVRGPSAGEQSQQADPAATPDARVAPQ
jgi:aerobic-type carbon monoxide dehydrogenase small subunit (CoxS/CutS family)